MGMKTFILIYMLSLKITESKITRGHKLTLVKEQSRQSVRKYSFSQSTINVWNTLSADCEQTSSVVMFMNRIDKYMYLAKAGYIYNRGRLHLE